MGRIRDETTVKPGEDCLSTTVDDETVILDPDSGIYYGTNAVGAYIWELVTEERITVDRIIASVAAEFDVSRDECASDIESYLDELTAKGLLEIHDAE